MHLSGGNGLYRIVHLRRRCRHFHPERDLGSRIFRSLAGIWRVDSLRHRSRGFATSLALYDNSGNQFAHDYLGGTAVGASCSNGAQQDPVTGFCEDATMSFFLPAGLYTLTLSVQGNDGPDPFSNGFPLSPGDNFPGGPFQDPGAPGSVIRTGNWAVDITLTGDITLVGAVPEPSTAIFTLTGAAAVLCVRRRRRTRIQ